MQDRHNYIANTLELPLSCTNPSIYSPNDTDNSHNHEFTEEILWKYCLQLYSHQVSQQKIASHHQLTTPLSCHILMNHTNLLKKKKKKKKKRSQIFVHNAPDGTLSSEKKQYPHPPSTFSSWWRHQMETFSALLALCAGNSPVTREFPSQRPVTRSFIFSLICAWINGWVNNLEAGDLRRHRGHYDITVMLWPVFSTCNWRWITLKHIDCALLQ